MMPRSSQVALLALIFVATLAGCASKSQTMIDIGQPCAPNNGIITTLVNPAPGSSNNPDAFTAVTLGSSGALASTFQVYITATTYTNTGSTKQQLSGYYTTLVNAASPASPVPMDGSQILTAFQQSDNPGITWPAGSTIDIYLGNQAEGCVATEFLGSFTVQ